MKLKIHFTERGFAFAEFTDANGQQCSIQESSLATQAAIWLGAYGERMHLTQEQAKALIPLLKRFVRSGQIRKEEA